MLHPYGAIGELLGTALSSAIRAAQLIKMLNDLIENKLGKLKLKQPMVVFFALVAHLFHPDTGYESKLFQNESGDHNML